MAAEKRSVDILQRLLGTDPRGLAWPVSLDLTVSGRRLTVTYDPHNARLEIRGAQCGDLARPRLNGVSDIGLDAPELCSRLLVFAAAESGDWREAGFVREGRVAGFWPEGREAVLWAKMWGDRASAGAAEQPPVLAERPAPDPAPGWICRPAAGEDSADIGRLLREVFAGYPIPEDPGSIRYALASGEVHGRLIRRPDGRLAAYASLEFSGPDGAAEITDCATLPAARGRGLMAHLVRRLVADLVDVFDDRGAYSLARSDQPAMARVLARCGWRRRGYLVHHYRIGERWCSAGLWQPGSEDQAAE